MAKYLIKDTIPTYVTYLYEVTAENNDDAMQAYIDGEVTERGYELANIIDEMGGGTTDIEEIAVEEKE